MSSNSKAEQIHNMALRILGLAKDSIIVNMRFMDIAVNGLVLKETEGLVRPALDGEFYAYDPKQLLRMYASGDNRVARCYLHSLFHCIFNHRLGYDKLDARLWDMCCDMAVENAILELQLDTMSVGDDDIRQDRIRRLKKSVTPITAERLYRHYRVNELAEEDMLEYEMLFRQDDHFYWREPEKYEISAEQWRKISTRIKTDLKTFSKDSAGSESMFGSLDEASIKKVNYRALLERFCVTGEELTVNDEEFDYVYYHYGLTHYDNMPFIEPLEFRDVRKVRDFAIVLDTSASCKGSTVETFLRQTYEILMNSESFHTHVNVHIIQCDNEVRSDRKITCIEEMDEYISGGKLFGFGGTDFRPAFEYVDRLIDEGEFDDFKGMIYFTDGYGIYPPKAPNYDSMFVFLKEDLVKPEVPWWAVRVVLSEEELT